LHGQQALCAADGEHEMLPRLALPDSPMGTALDLVAPAVVQLTADGSEPLLPLVAVGAGVPHGVVRSFRAAPQNHRDGAGVAPHPLPPPRPPPPPPPRRPGTGAPRTRHSSRERERVGPATAAGNGSAPHPPQQPGE